MRNGTFSSASFRPKRLKSSFQLFRVTRNDQKEVFGHFGSPETTQKRFSAISGHRKRPQRGFRPFRVTGNDPKEVFGHFGSPETIQKRFSAISGHRKRPKRGFWPFRATRNDRIETRLPTEGEFWGILTPVGSTNKSIECHPSEATSPSRFHTYPRRSYTPRP